jgi:toxin-antitoxin system PIN domain toxin
MPTWPGSRALLDTNILVYAMNEDAPAHEACRALREKGVTGQADLCITAQVLFEYFAVVTSPNSLPTPLAAEEALADIEKLAKVFPLLPAPVDLHERVFELLRATGMSGRHVFDLELAATMLANDVATIYTFDPRFAKLPGITSREP